MTLRQKTLVITGLLLISLMVLLLVVTGVILRNSYHDLQTQYTHDNVQQALNVLDREIGQLSATTWDYARWDDTYRFAQGNYPTYPEDNLPDIVFSDFIVNYMIFTDLAGQVIYSEGFDFASQQTIDVPQAIFDYVAATPSLYTFSEHPESLQGVVALPDTLYVVTARPISLSDVTQGPVIGATIWWRVIDAAELQRLSELTRLSIDIRPFNSTTLPDDFQAARAALSADTPFTTQTLDENRIAGYRVIDDILGQPAMILRVDIPRSIEAQGQESLIYFFIALGITSIVMIAATLILLERLVLARLDKLSADVGRIGRNRELSSRVQVTGSDELSALASEINNMLKKLEEDQTSLNEAKNAAEHANRVKTTFLANMSHELRTPLNSIIGFLNLMLMGNKLDEKDRYRAERAHANSERLLSLINDVLDISRIEAGRMQLVSSPVVVRELVESLQKQLLVLAEEKELSLNIQIDETVPGIIHIDGDALQKIITNLISNAIKFTEHGGVEANITSTEQHLTLKVSDTGIGIAPHLHEMIFESFRQVDDSSTRAYGGSGLGLAIVQNICKLMGGTVNLESIPGKGSTFTVTMPLESTKVTA